MRPLSLKGHDRALTRVRLNREGDLLFSSSKGKSVCVWFTENGERLGTYDGHNGAIWDVDVSWDSNHLVSSAADNTMKVGFHTNVLFRFHHPYIPGLGCRKWPMRFHSTMQNSMPFSSVVFQWKFDCFDNNQDRDGEGDFEGRGHERSGTNGWTRPYHAPDARQPKYLYFLTFG